MKTSLGPGLVSTVTTAIAVVVLLFSIAKMLLTDKPVDMGVLYFTLALFLLVNLPDLSRITNLKFGKDGIDVTLDQVQNPPPNSGAITMRGVNPDAHIPSGPEFFNDVRLSAQIRPDPDRPNWALITLTCGSPSTRESVGGSVVFNLDASFPRPRRVVPIENNVAELNVSSWGTFLVTAEWPDPPTKLSLNLATVGGGPVAFYSL